MLILTSGPIFRGPVQLGFFIFPNIGKGLWADDELGDVGGASAGGLITIEDL
jgi:hypothetical protein